MDAKAFSLGAGKGCLFGARCRSAPKVVPGLADESVNLLDEPVLDFQVPAPFDARGSRSETYEVVVGVGTVVMVAPGGSSNSEAGGDGE